jgi:hypothetical protein
MDPARAKAASNRVLGRLTNPLMGRAIDPVMGTPRPRTVDSEGLYRASEPAPGAERGHHRLTIPTISREPVQSPARTSAERSPSGEPAPSRQAESRQIRVDVRIGVSLAEIEESIVRQVYELEGTQLQAANALGITPDTVSRIMRRSARRRVSPPQVPSAWPVARPTEMDGVNAEELVSPAPLAPFTRNPVEVGSAPPAPGYAQAPAAYD